MSRLRDWQLSLALVPTLLALVAPRIQAQAIHDSNVAIMMRDSVVLRADVWRPAGDGPFPVLVYRTPYGKTSAEGGYKTFSKAVERGYAVVIQDVRGRYASAGEFNPYRNEGHDGYDTIEWAAAQSWSNGSVGTFGLSYPGAVQWLAAVESPPHLKAMVPAMTFSRPETFFYSGGVWDLSWISWAWYNIAPDALERLGRPLTDERVSAAWDANGETWLHYLPLNQLEALRAAAPWYYEWLDHPPADPWWDWADITTRYRKTNAAVLNISGWYDEGYGPTGAIENFLGLRAARAGRPSRTQLVIGPWPHGVSGIGRSKAGDRTMGANAALDYDELVLSWMDRYVRDIRNGIDTLPRVRAYLMGANKWLTGNRWPLPGTGPLPLYLSGGDSIAPDGRLVRSRSREDEAFSVFFSDPEHPLTDPYGDASGAHDYNRLTGRTDMLSFDTAPLDSAVDVLGSVTADLYFSVDNRDTDFYVRLIDVAPDGTAYNLMHPGLTVQRASARNSTVSPELLVPNQVYHLQLTRMLTGNRFLPSHRIRIQVSASFFPWFSRNLHTGYSDITGDVMAPARITVYHDRTHPSRITLTVRQ
ncbi:MAG: CocE/NonD family hydrolase [Gemmatimonadota bacterium]